jgi:hypothetical protein
MFGGVSTGQEEIELRGEVKIYRLTVGKLYEIM